MTNLIEAEGVLDAAAHSLIIERCRAAYLHDMRGGLQAIAATFELLARLARSGERNPDAAERASAIAKRELANHENSMLEMIEQITLEQGGTAAVDLAQLVNDIIRFLRNDIASKQIEIGFSRTGDTMVQAEKNKLRMILLGLIALCIDDCAAGAELSIRVGDSSGGALIEIGCAVAAQSPAELAFSQRRRLVLQMARQWILAHHGTIELEEHAGRSDIRILYPLTQTPAGSLLRPSPEA